MSKIKNNVVSFDYDGTLNDHFGGQNNPHKEKTRDWVKCLIGRGYDVHIITRRYGPENQNKGKTQEHVIVWQIADQLGVSRDKVIFMNREFKFSAINKINSIIHVDDDLDENFWIERNSPGTKFIWLEDKNWETNLTNELSQHDKLSIWFSSDKNITKFGIVLGILLTLAILAL